MNLPAAPAAAGVPFFMRTQDGQRLCIYHAPPTGVALRSALLYVHPFAEELNRSRRMVALQARALAAAGVAVLLIDLHGCGDSSGDFADARWAIWKDDLALAHAWLADASGMTVGLWGLRLGALLALDYARQATLPVARFILWQPVLHGEAGMTQFLRLRLAGAMLAGEPDAGAIEGTVEGTVEGAAKHDTGSGAGGTKALRALLQAGQSLEVAGYELAPALVQAIDGVDAAALGPSGCDVTWFDMVSDASRPPSPASQRLAARWTADGVRVQLHAIPGVPFWATQEIAESPALLAATLAALCAEPA